MLGLWWRGYGPHSVSLHVAFRVRLEHWLVVELATDSAYAVEREQFHDITRKLANYGQHCFAHKARISQHAECQPPRHDSYLKRTI